MKNKGLKEKVKAYILELRQRNSSEGLELHVHVRSNSVYNLLKSMSELLFIVPQIYVVHFPPPFPIYF